MKNGIKKPSRILDRRKYSFHRTFGGVTPDLFPLEFSVDSGFPMKNQNAEGLPYGCTGFAQTDLCESQDLTPYNEKFVYTKTLEMEGKSGDEACLIEDSLKVICSVGIERIDKSNKPEDNKRGAYFLIEL